ncbi:MAG: nucleoside kinase, partial [Candidatus Marinimicrobia bacterium]|nr:nucleoside kinase [Candidatus Neomarinimicrobiota bacterium]
MFNTALVYELPVLAKYAKPLLESVSENSPVKMRAERLSVFLSFFEQLEETAVPETSILREFIGGSGFHY